MTHAELVDRVWGCALYRGGCAVFVPNMVDVIHMVAEFEDSPVAYSLDVGVFVNDFMKDDMRGLEAASRDRTALVEVNAGALSLGYYGGIQ